MAESAIFFVAQSLSDLLIQKAVVLRGVHKQVEWLRDELQRMQCFLKDMDAKQEEDKRVQNWVYEIRNAAYDAEDTIDTFILKIESQKKKGFVKRYTRIFKELSDLRRVRKEIESFKVRLRDISISCEAYGIRSVGEGSSSTARERLRQMRRSSPRGLERDLVGLQKDTAQLVAQLLKKEDRRTVISIVGMGGIGKTTLAKRVFNHNGVRVHFNCHAWVYVSQECRPKDILQAIIRQVTGPSKELLQIIESLQEDELEKMLYEHLEEKRYLVVLDDIWNTEDWDVLERAFPETNNGCKLLLTTRNRDVALHARSVPYELRLLSEEDSWELFLRKVFIDEADTSCHQELEEIGREIVGKCAGLPLAIIVIGGLLFGKRLVSEWERVLNNILSHFASGQTGVLAILALSYSDLPHYLKYCFLHLGLFPEDCVISTRKLFQLWIAEGLIPHREEGMESTAEEYLNELTDRNMVQVVRTSANKRIKQCQIHDVLRDLSILKAKDEIFLEIPGKKRFSPSVKSRHQAIYSNFDRYFLSKPSTPRLRSLLLFNSDDSALSTQFSELNIHIICSSFKLLRVLELENIRVGHLPSEIGQLINLRYLGLRSTGIYMLRSSMRHLQSLQTLDISGNVSLYRIPNVICNMENLRHLYMNALCIRKLRIDTLRHLQTLSSVHVDNWKQNNSENLTSLRKLGVAVSTTTDVDKFFNSIAKLEHLLSLHLVSEDASVNYLPSLTRLSQLHCLTKLRIEGRIRMLPGSHEFPPNVTQLTLQGSRLNQCPMSILKGLPKLSILRLRKHSYVAKQLTISANWFPQLKFLELEGLSGLEELIIGKGSMPRLRHFRISSCRELTELPLGLKFMSALQELEINKMPGDFVDRLQRADSHKVKHIHSIIFD